MEISRRTVVVFLALLIVVHVFVVFFNWYSDSFVDLTLHILGGIWSALFFGLLFEHFISLHLHHHFSEKIKLLIIVISFASLMGVAWELNEFILSGYIYFYLQESIGQVMNGLIATMVGGGAGGWLMFYGKSGQKNDIS